MGSGAGDLDVKGVEEGRGDRKSRGGRGEPRGAEAKDRDHSAPTAGRAATGVGRMPGEEGRAWVRDEGNPGYQGAVSPLVSGKEGSGEER